MHGDIRSENITRLRDDSTHKLCFIDIGDSLLSTHNCRREREAYELEDVLEGLSDPNILEEARKEVER